MAAMDFPVPTYIGQQYSNGTTTWQWDGVTWNIVPQPGPMAIGDLPPPNPAIGQQWFRSSNGQLYVWYNDGNSSQWVQAAAPGQKGVDPYQFITADMALVSMAAGVVGLNSKADGSGVSSKLWTDANNQIGKTQNGYQKFASGLIVQWGFAGGTANDIGVTFPTAFTGSIVFLAASPISGAIPGNQAIVVNIDNPSQTGFAARPRYIGAGTVGVANQSYYWLAMGV